MNRIPIADWAAQAPWAGITGKPSWIGTTGPEVDLSQVTWKGQSAGYVFWNGKIFLPTTINTQGGTKIKDGDQPAIAVRRRPPGNPSGSFENVWQRFVFNVKLYGALGGGVDDLPAINAAIADLNAAGVGMLYFPAGYYRASAPFDRITAMALVKGDGIGVTTLSFDGFDGVTFDPSNSDAWNGIQDLMAENVGTAITYRGGNAYASEIGIQCSRVGLEVGLAGTSLGETLFSGLTLEATQAGAVGINLYSESFRIADSDFLGSGSQWLRGIDVFSGTAGDIHDCYFGNCSSQATRLQASSSGVRVHDILFAGIGAAPVLDSGVNNYVNELFGLGGNAVTDFDNRKELYSIFSWGPGTIAPGYGFYDDFAVTGARPGDQCILGAPYSFDPGVSSDIRVVSADTVRAILYNLGTTVVDLATGSWKMRVFN